MRIPWVALILAVFALATGCGGQSFEPTSTMAPPDLNGVRGDRSVSVGADHGLRTVFVHHPDSVGARAPLVVVLHGEGASAEQARDDLGWNAVADHEGFVVAYPEGVDHGWNAGPSCCFPNNAGVNDVGFLNEALSILTKQDLIDRSRVYAVGFSAGGSMAYTWECAHPGLLAGIGPVDADLLIECRDHAPVTVAAVYGGTDRLVPPVDIAAAARVAAPWAAPAGSALGSPRQAGPPAGTEDQALALFRAIDSCPHQPAAAIGGPPATERSWNCAATHSVSAAVVEGAGHQWPGASAPMSSSLVPDSDAAVSGEATTSTRGGDRSAFSVFETDQWLWDHLRNARSR